MPLEPPLHTNIAAKFMPKISILDNSRLIRCTVVSLSYLVHTLSSLPADAFLSSMSLGTSAVLYNVQNLFPMLVPDSEKA